MYFTNGNKIISNSIIYGIILDILLDCCADAKQVTILLQQQRLS